MTTHADQQVEEFTVLSGFCGVGGMTLGFQNSRVTLNGRQLRFRSLGGVDSDPLACADFEYLTKSPALCADVKTLTPARLREFVGIVPPDCVMGSAPCKGFSGLLSTKASKHPRYQEMNRLALDWLELVLSTWDVSPKLILFENVPRIAKRGAVFLAEMKAILHGAGFLTHEQTHDCGVLGGLAQHRQRYLLAGRHAERCPPLLYQPPPQRVRACGEVLGALPLPEDPTAGPMHRLPRISALNWIRLSLIPAGGDWRDLEGVLKDGQPRREVHRRHRVEAWGEPSATVAGSGSNAVSNVADPRVAEAQQIPGLVPKAAYDHGYGVLSFAEPSPTVAGGSAVGQGAYSVADIRFGVYCAHCTHKREEHTFDQCSADGCSCIVFVASEYRKGTYGVLSWEDAAGTIIGNARVDAGPHYAPLSRHWVHASEMEERAADFLGDRDWLFGWRDVSKTQNERTVVAAVVPRAAVANNFPLLFSPANPGDLAAAYASLCSFAFDYAARQKLGGTHLNYFVLKQLPVLAPAEFAVEASWSRGSTITEWLVPRVLELSYTAWELEAFGRDLGYRGTPFRWDAGRRFQLRCELDAAFFHIYGLARDDVDYVMETFPIVRKNDEKAHGEYRTKRVILETYDALAKAAQAGKPYRTPLDPLPAAVGASHGWFDPSGTPCEYAEALRMGLLFTVIRRSGEAGIPQGWLSRALLWLEDAKHAATGLSGAALTDFERVRESDPLLAQGTSDVSRLLQALENEKVITRDANGFVRLRAGSTIPNWLPQTPTLAKLASVMRGGLEQAEAGASTTTAVEKVPTGKGFV